MPSSNNTSIYILEETHLNVKKRKKKEIKTLIVGKIYAKKADKVFWLDFKGKKKTNIFL